MFVCILAKLQQVDYITLYYSSILCSAFLCSAFLKCSRCKITCLVESVSM